MSIRRKIESNIKKKEDEIQELKDKLRAAESYVQALQDTLRQLPKDTSNGSDDMYIRAGSRVAKALNVLKKNNKPMHVMDILKALGEDTNKNNRASLSGSLSAYVRDGKVFTRPGPNMFGLIEWGTTDTVQEEVPEDFGIVK